MKDPSIPSSEAAPTPPSGKASGIVAGRQNSKSKYVWVAALIVVVAALVACLWPQKKSDLRESIVWLTPAEAAQGLQPGKLTRLKWKFMGMSKVIRTWYTKGRTLMSIDSRFLTIPDEVLPLTELASHSWTNADGMRAWILSAEEWTSLKMRLPISLQAAKAADTRMGITSFDSFYSAGSSAMGSVVSKVQVLPRVADGHFNLLLEASSTEPTTSPTGSFSGTQTNFALACRVVLSNGGALVVDGRKRGDAAGTNYWFITSVVVVDPAGNPKKLGK